MGYASFLNVVIVNTAVPMLIYIIAYPITFYKVFPLLRPSLSLVNLRSAMSLGGLGVRFFWLQMAGVIQMMTANILISKLFSPEIVTPYQIAYRYFSLVLAAFTVICMPFWNATTDAYERNDIKWIQYANKRMRTIVIALGLCIVLMVAISPLVYNLWIGSKCEVPFGITLMVAIYTFIIIASSRYSYFLNGIGALRLQMYMTVTVVFFIPLAWLVSHLTHDINYFLAVMCICIAPSWIVNKIQFNKIINGKATGIWKK
jgi:O-antigen/teichoic acid export membrane protein